MEAGLGSWVKLKNFLCPASLPQRAEVEKKVKVIVAWQGPTLCDPMDCSPPGSSVHGNLHARILEWAAFPSPWDLPNPGIEPGSPTLQADSLPSEAPGKPRALQRVRHMVNVAIIIVHLLVPKNPQHIISLCLKSYQFNMFQS